MTRQAGAQSSSRNRVGREGQTAGRRRPWVTFVALAILPLVLLGILVWAIVGWGPAEALRGDGYPPVELLQFQQVELKPEGIFATVLNDGPDPITIAQVQVDEAYWKFSLSSDATLRHLDRTVVAIPYPWVRGESHQLRVLTSTGAAFDHQIAVAVDTPRWGLRFFGIFTLIGLYVGVIPVAIGLLWFPFVRRLGPQGLAFLLALTIGLLVFLVIDALDEGLEAASSVAGSYQGVAILIFTAIGAYLCLEAVGEWFLKRRLKTASKSGEGAAGKAVVLASLVAAGIGLHNFSEGLAIGGAFALGEAALGSLLVIGFTLHNTTEGLAIVAPMAEQSQAGRTIPIKTLVRLGLIGGAPTVLGAWLGGSVYSVVWAVVFLGVGAGAIAQVIAQILRQTADNQPIPQYLARPAVLSGLFAGFLIMYSTGLLIG